MRSTAAVFLFVLCLAATQAAVPQQPYDLLIVNGRVLDGTGNPWRRADIGITGDRIAAVGTMRGARAARTIDAAGRIVAPGFIDVHSHATEALARAAEALAGTALRDAQPLLAQGITTIIGNPDGGGPVDLAAQRDALEKGGTGVNVGLMIGHGSVRSA